MGSQLESVKVTRYKILPYINYLVIQIWTEKVGNGL